MPGESKPNFVPIAEEAVKGLYEGVQRPTHDELWDHMGPAEAPFARAVLVRAEEIRREGVDPGNAYVEGSAASLAAIARTKVLEAFEVPDTLPVDEEAA